jgi:hypothetical protein
MDAPAIKVNDKEGLQKLYEKYSKWRKAGSRLDNRINNVLLGTLEFLTREFDNLEYKAGYEPLTDDLYYLLIYTLKFMKNEQYFLFNQYAFPPNNRPIVLDLNTNNENSMLETAKLEAVKDYCKLAVPSFVIETTYEGQQQQQQRKKIYGPFSQLMHICLQSQNENIDEILEKDNGIGTFEQTPQIGGRTVYRYTFEYWAYMSSKLASWGGLLEFIVSQVIEPIFNGSFDRASHKAYYNKRGMTLNAYQEEWCEIGSVRFVGINKLHRVYVPYIFPIFEGAQIWNPLHCWKKPKEPKEEAELVTVKPRDNQPLFHAGDGGIGSFRMDYDKTVKDLLFAKILNSRNQQQQQQKMIDQLSILFDKRPFKEKFVEDKNTNIQLILRNFFTFDADTLNLLLQYGIASTAFDWYWEYFKFTSNGPNDVYLYYNSEDLSDDEEIEQKSDNSDMDETEFSEDDARNLHAQMFIQFPSEFNGEYSNDQVYRWLKAQKRISKKILGNCERKMIECREEILKRFNSATQKKWKVSLPKMRDVDMTQTQPSTGVASWPIYGEPPEKVVILTERILNNLPLKIKKLPVDNKSN